MTSMRHDHCYKFNWHASRWTYRMVTAPRLLREHAIRASHSRIPSSKTYGNQMQAPDLVERNRYHGGASAHIVVHLCEEHIGVLPPEAEHPERWWMPRASARK